MRLASYVLLIAVAAVVLLFVVLIAWALSQTWIPSGSADKKKKSVTKRSQLRYLAEEIAEAHLNQDKLAAANGVRELEEISSYLKERDFAFFRREYEAHLSSINDQHKLVEQEIGELKYVFARQVKVAEARAELKD